MASARWVLAAVAATVGLSTGCKKTPAPAAANGTGGPLVVKVASPKRQTLHWTVEQPATVAAYEVTPVAAKLAGYIREIAPDVAARTAGRANAVIDSGSVVEKGQPLAVLDIPELVEEGNLRAAAVDQAKAELDQVKKDLAVLDALVAAGQAGVKEAEAGVTKATADFDRWKTELTQADDFLQKGVLDAQSRAVVFKQFRSAEAAKAESEARQGTASANLTERQARRTKADADVATAAARIKVADAAAKEVEARLTYRTITAPFDGLVTARNVHTRHFVQPPMGAGSVPLFVVARLDVLRVLVDVPEVSAARAAAGAKAVVRIPALGNEEFAGTVARTAGVVTPDTRTLKVEIDLSNEKRTIQPGMYAFVRIEAEAADATMLSGACILPADETHYVYIVEGDKAVKYRVRPGRTDGANVQVLGRRKATSTAGDWAPFSGAEKVVIGNLGALTDGAAVEVKE